MNSKKRSKKYVPTKTAVKKILLESVFDPRSDSPIAVVLETGSRDYWRQRAIEMLRMNGNITTVISLLAMVRAYDDSILFNND